jgi:hypothetical protein
MKFKPTKYIAWTLAVCLLNVGCAAFHLDKIKKEDGYYIRHYNSCGPDAIQDALRELENEYIATREISRKIQDDGNARRTALTLIHYNALWITWPAELVKYFRDRGYKVTTTTLDSLSPEDTAIVLIKGRILKQEWHWITFPTNSKKHIKNFYKSFGGDTTVMRVYKIETAK